MRSVFPANAWALKQLLRRKFEKAMEGMPEYHSFSNIQSTYTLTLEVDAHEFGEMVVERELAQYKSELKKLQKEYDELKEKYEPKIIVPTPLLGNDEFHKANRDYQLEDFYSKESTEFRS